MSVCRYLDYYLKKGCVRVNDDACVYMRACACVLGKYVLLLLFLFWVCFCCFLHKKATL